MTIEWKGKWIKYSSNWPIIGKYRRTWYFTIRRVLKEERIWGYSYDEYEGFTFHSFELLLFGISWGTGYSTHKDNKAR